MKLEKTVQRGASRFGLLIRYSVYHIQDNEMGGLCETGEECMQAFGGET
jgi:hypothetical protein